MIRYFLYAFLITVIYSAPLFSQTYQYSAYPGGLGGNSGAGGPLFKQQCIYTKSNFGSMPAGRVKAIYIRVGNAYSLSGSPCLVKGFTAKIGYTYDSSFISTNDTFRNGLTTIYGPDTFSVPCTGSVGQWIMIPVKKGNFQYKPEGAKFIVEIECGPQSNPNMSFPFLMSSNPRSYKGTIYAYNLSDNFGAIAYAGMDLGFDLGQPSEVEGLTNITRFSLFPNPTSNGYFNISVEASQPVNDVIVTITNVTGQQIHKQQYHNIGTKFFNGIDISSSSKGIYFIEIMADGERIIRRVVIE